jgi:hypothetical protein
MQVTPQSNINAMQRSPNQTYRRCNGPPFKYIGDVKFPIQIYRRWEGLPIRCKGLTIKYIGDARVSPIKYNIKAIQRSPNQTYRRCKGPPFKHIGDVRFPIQISRRWKGLPIRYVGDARGPPIKYIGDAKVLMNLSGGVFPLQRI